MKVHKVIASVAIISVQLLVAYGVSAGEIVGWGNNSFFRFLGIPLSSSATGVVSVARFDSCDTVAVSAVGRGLALCKDGLVSGWLYDWGGLPGPPQELTNVVAISTAIRHGMALKADGTVEVWGDGAFGKTQLPSTLHKAVAIAAGFEHCLAVRRDGELVGWGETRTPPGQTNVVAISASQSWGGRDIAVRSDGTVIEWDNRNGVSHAVSGLSNVVAVAAGAGHRLALKADGTVFGWGSNATGEATGAPTSNGFVETAAAVQLTGAVLSNVVAIAASGSSFPASGYSLAVKKDGTIVAWGKGLFNQTDVPAGLSNVVAIAAGETYCLAITTNAVVAERFRRSSGSRPK